MRSFNKTLAIQPCFAIIPLRKPGKNALKRQGLF